MAAATDRFLCTTLFLMEKQYFTVVPGSRWSYFELLYIQFSPVIKWGSIPSKGCLPTVARTFAKRSFSDEKVLLPPTPFQTRDWDLCLLARSAL